MKNEFFVVAYFLFLFVYFSSVLHRLRLVEYTKACAAMTNKLEVSKNIYCYCLYSSECGLVTDGPWTTQVGHTSSENGPCL